MNSCGNRPVYVMPDPCRLSVQAYGRWYNGAVNVPMEVDLPQDVDVLTANGWILLGPIEPVLSMGTVTSVPANQGACATITGIPPNQVLNLQIPAGESGNGVLVSLEVGNVTTLPPGSNATVSITGNDVSPILNFGLPQGNTGSTGNTGANGPAANIHVGNVTTGAPGANACVTITGNVPNQAINFTIPTGNTGPQGNVGATGANGPANNLAVGNVISGANACVTITGAAPNQTINFTLPQGNAGANGAQGNVGPQGNAGAAGANGPANNLTVGNVVTGAAGSNAAVSITGAAPNQTINFTIPTGNTGPQGNVGATGANGPANNLAVGNVVSGANACVTITGVAPNQTINFTLPQGNAGANGANGAQGNAGVAGANGPANNLTVGNVVTGAPGSNAAVTLTGVSPNQIISFNIPAGNAGANGAQGNAGAAGANGPANNLTVGNVVTGAPGSNAAVTLTGAAPNQTINFNIPQGNAGAAGNAGVAGANGPANNLAVGNVTTLPYTSNATVTITGNSPAQTINLGIPQGAPPATPYLYLAGLPLGVDVTANIQANINALYAACGFGTIVLPPAPVNTPLIIGMLVVPGTLSFFGSGIGSTFISMPANVALATIYQRFDTSGNGSAFTTGNFPALQRALIYLTPQTPYDPSGQVVTASSCGITPRIGAFTVFGNKSNQNNQPVSVVYAPYAKSDPSYLFVSGAYQLNQVAQPGNGTVNINADPKGYEGFITEEIESYAMSGYGFFIGNDRQRSKIGNKTRCINSGITDSTGNILCAAGGYDIRANDCLVLAGTGWGGNTHPCRHKGVSGASTTQVNSWSQQIGSNANANPNAYITLIHDSVNGAYVQGTFNAAYVATIDKSDGQADTPVCIFGCSFKLDKGLYVTGNQIAGVTSDDQDAFIQIQGYRHASAAATSFAQESRGNAFKYAISATQCGGVCYSGFSATSETAYKPYRANYPIFPGDNSNGVAGGQFLDPFTQILHIGVSFRGSNNAGVVQYDSPVSFTQGVTGAANGTLLIPATANWATTANLVPADLTPIFVTDLGPAGCDFIYRTALSKWVPRGRQCIYQTVDGGITGNATSNEQLMLAVPIPANLLANQLFSIVFATTNNDFVDAEANVAVRLNSAACIGTPGVSELWFETGFANTKNSEGRPEQIYRSHTLTGIKKMGTAGASGGSFTGGTSTVQQTTFDVSNAPLNTPTFMCFVMSMTGNTTIPVLQYFRLELLPSGL